MRRARPVKGLLCPIAWRTGATWSKAARENLGMEHKYGTSAGATSVHELPNGVQFGLARPEVKYTGHTDNEFKTVDQFLLDLQIVTEMMGRIGQLPTL